MKYNLMVPVDMIGEIKTLHLLVAELRVAGCQIVLCGPNFPLQFVKRDGEETSEDHNSAKRCIGLLSKHTS